MRKKIKLMWMVQVLILILMFALAGCGADKKEDSAQTTDVSGESINTSDNDESTEQKTTAAETVADETQSASEIESETKNEMVAETTVPTEAQTTVATKAPTTAPTTAKVDKDAEYKEIVAYVESTGLPYKYVTNDAEYLAFAESCEGKDFYIIYPKDAYGSRVNLSGLPMESTFDVSTSGGDGTCKTYYGYTKRTWRYSEFVNGRKAYKILSESDIDAAIADISKYGDMGDEIEVLFIWRADWNDYESTIINKWGDSYDTTALYMSYGFSYGTSGNSNYSFGYHNEILRKKSNVEVETQ